MQPTFRSSYFAILESHAPQLIAGPEARTPQPSARPFAAGAVPIFGALGQSDWHVETDYANIRAGVKRLLQDSTVKTIDLIVDSPGGSVLGLPGTADAIHAANRVKPVRAFVTGIAPPLLIDPPLWFRYADPRSGQRTLLPDDLWITRAGPSWKT